VASVLGFCCRTGSAAAVAIGADRGFAGRWTVDLSAPGLPVQLFHAAAGLRDAEAVVRDGVAAVGAVAAERLDALLAGLDGPVVVAVVVGEHPVPDDVPVTRILAVHTLMHAAEGQLFRDAVLDAAVARGLVAHGVARRAAERLLAGDLAGAVARIGAAAGRPWRKEQKLATVAALVAVRSGEA